MNVSVMWTCPRVTVEGDEELVTAIDSELFWLMTTPVMERFWDEAARNAEHRAP